MLQVGRMLRRSYSIVMLQCQHTNYNLQDVCTAGVSGQLGSRIVKELLQNGVSVVAGAVTVGPWTYASLHQKGAQQHSPMLLPDCRRCARGRPRGRCTGIRTAVRADQEGGGQITYDPAG
jgi:hypothetical protein